jgi:hypothetical protein
MKQILSYGGGRQTIAICVLIARGILPKPDAIVMADTGREAPTTWTYLATHVKPLLATVGLEVEIASRDLAKVDLHAHNGDLLLPVYTGAGKLRGWCSGEWKRDVCDRHLKSNGIESGVLWIGYALDERRRVTRMLKSERRERFGKRFPLVELMLTTSQCVELVKNAGLPEPPVSSCWMCPNRKNAEWRLLRDECPPEFTAACDLDDELRRDDIEDGHSGVYLHHSRKPLREADLDADDAGEISRQCGLGMCFV